ncbi:hypothetical protein H6503_01260 [Candidatus Woesearchaeota archaeon]|nr:hypothetical protein [Candidatus Woesearchaeota archaeon]
MEEERKAERQTAKIVSIKEISTGKYLKQEGWEPNYILTRSNEKVSRANVIGVVVTVPENSSSAFIDDGTGKIELRSFDGGPNFSNITIGDILIVIGRPREYNNEIYINAEVIRKIENKGWLEFRKKEIALKNLHAGEDIEQENEQVKDENVEPQKIEEIDLIDSLLMKIKELDKGEGCNIEELGETFENADDIVSQLLLRGEIFEIAPGRVKVLE